MSPIRNRRLASAVMQTLESRVLFSSTSGLSLSPATSIPMGGTPTAIMAINDYLGAGLATANSSGKISVFLSQQEQPTLHISDGLGSTTQGLPVLMAAADLNGDGLDDLVLFNAGSDRGSVLLGKNNIKPFSQPHLFTVNGNVDSIALADVTGDGKADLVIGYFDGSLTVRPGNGDGTFQSPQTIISASKPINSIQAADFGNSGEDLVITHSGGAVGVLLNQGSGTFVAKNVANPGVAQFQIALGDIKGDGKTDLVIVDHDGSYITLLGNGDGTFQTPIKGTVGNRVNAVTMADLNQDGSADLITAGGSVVDVLLGQNTGDLVSRHVYPIGQTPVAVVASASTGDGFSDILTADEDGNVSFLRNTTPSTLFEDGPAIPSQISDASSVILADLNGDGKLDLLAVDNPVSYDRDIAVFLGNGDGTFKLISTLPLPSRQYEEQMAVGDINGDGIPDIVVTSGKSLLVFLGNGDGTFKSAVTTSLVAQPMSLAVADLNGDGKADVVVDIQGYNVNNYLGGQPPPSRNASLEVLLGNGDGTFHAPAIYSIGGNTDYVGQVAIADLNGDGHADIVATNRSKGDVVVLLNNGDGTFAAPVDYAVPGHPDALAVGKLASGLTDIVVGDNGVGKISILANNGNGTFSLQQNLAASSGYLGDIAISDINGDGIPDIIATNSSYLIGAGIGSILPLEHGSPSPNTATVFLGNSDGTFANAVNLFVGNNPTALAVGDVNGDGAADLVIGDTSSVRVYLELSQAPRMVSYIVAPIGYPV